ncbi:MAG TPA: hypothetical protein VGM84_15715 [Steroidobacteraceae bacterium]|jgi:hypothetical protein
MKKYQRFAAQQPEVRLEKVLEALTTEVAGATEQEVLDAAADLRMDPRLRGSVATLGVKGLVFPYRPGVFGPVKPDTGVSPTPEGPSPPTDTPDAS